MSAHESGTILVTGGAGYIGSQLVRDLLTDTRFSGRAVRVYDNLHRQQLSGILDLPPQAEVEFIEGDILDRVSLRHAMKGVSAVIHLAAIVRTPLSFDHPSQTEQINHWGTATVTDCALEAGVSAFVHASSAVVYGVGGPFRENDECRPIGPYAESKLRSEQEVIEAAERGLNATILRLGTVYGYAPAVRFDAAPNRFVYLAGIGRPMVLLGDGNQMRPFIHVRDAANAVMHVLHNPDSPGRVLNAVTINCRLSDVAARIAKFLPDARIRHAEQDFLSRVGFEVLPGRLEALGFRPSYDLEQGILELLGRFEGLSRRRNA
ncbi:MAG: SDR family oxidoreductase [Rhodothermales bacterium]|nr:SDR family oxidoreductase [Rhodothermales bacterium]